jgi:hypothetical protein
MRAAPSVSSRHPKTFTGADIWHCTKFGEDSIPSSVQTSSVDNKVTAGRTLPATNAINSLRRVHLEF